MLSKKNTIFQKDFILIVLGQVISLFGNAILRFALPLYLLRETGSATLFGAVTACSFLPIIVFSLLGGVLADRVNKRNIMVALDFLTAITIVIFYSLLGKSPLIPLMIVTLMLLYGISGTYQPSVQASIPALLKPNQIIQGNAVINMVGTLSNLLGPVIGGILLGVWGLIPILIISIVCFLCSAVMELFICIPYRKQPADHNIFVTVYADIKTSWHFIKNDKPAFISVVWILALFNFTLSAGMIVGIPIMVVNILQMSDAALGITQGALGLGGLAGGCLAGIIAPKLKIRYSYCLLIFCSVTAACMGIALLPMIVPALGYSLITAMAFITMAASTLFTIQMCAVVQQQTPPQLIGKIMAMIIAVASCAQPLGQAFYGILFDLCANFPWLIMFGSATVAFCISLYSKRAFARLEKENRSAPSVENLF